MLRLLNTRTSPSLSGMLVDRTRFVLFGAITSRIPKVSFLLSTPMIGNVLARRVRSFREC